MTETALLADFERARANLRRNSKKAGATIVLDDFGAGYASIGYLRELRFDQIKLDGGLVTAAQHSADGQRLLHAVVGLCEILGVSTRRRACRKRRDFEPGDRSWLSCRPRLLVDATPRPGSDSRHIVRRQARSRAAPSCLNSDSLSPDRMG